MGDVWSSATTLWESTVGGLCIGAFFRSHFVLWCRRQSFSASLPKCLVDTVQRRISTCSWALGGRAPGYLVSSTSRFVKSKSRIVICSTSCAIFVGPSNYGMPFRHERFFVSRRNVCGILRTNTATSHGPTSKRTNHNRTVSVSLSQARP